MPMSDERHMSGMSAGMGMVLLVVGGLRSTRRRAPFAFAFTTFCFLLLPFAFCVHMAAQRTNG
jgi:MYXO-CTERM domain-containing protein